jgi:hypothetical protein
MPATASTDRATAAIEELTEALKNPSAAKPFLNTGNKLNEAIAALTEMSSMNRTIISTSASKQGSVTVSPRVSGQRTTKEPTQKRTTTLQVVGSPRTSINPQIDPQMPVDPRLVHHRGTRSLSSIVSLDSFNSTNNIKNNTITNPNINDTNDIIIDTPTRRQLRTRATEKK